MTLQQLEYIVALDEYRHFVTAAEHCFVSQPNLTMQVKKLEEEVGVKIFDRNKKPLQPTVIGKEIIIRARQILRESRQLTEFVNYEKESMEGELKIGIIPTLAPYLLPNLLPLFVKEYPKIHLTIQEVQTEQVISRIKSGVIDMGILVTPITETAIKEFPVFYEPFLLYLPEKHRLFQEKLLVAEDLDPSEILVLDEGHCFRDQALAICNNAKSGTSIGFDYQSGSIETLKSLVRHGVGFTLVPELSVMDELESDHVRRFADPQPVREVSIVVHNSFIKDSLITQLQETIRRVVPDRLLQKHSVVEFQS